MMLLKFEANSLASTQKSHTKTISSPGQEKLNYLILSQYQNFSFFPKIKKTFLLFQLYISGGDLWKSFPFVTSFFSDCKFCFIILLENKFDWSKVFVMNRGNFSMESHGFGGNSEPSIFITKPRKPHKFNHKKNTS
jgi:hypothetical protein